MSELLNKAVDSLIEPTKVRLYREDTKQGHWQTIPSLWDMLTTSAQWRGQGGSAGGVFGSRPVIATGIVSLVMEITAATKEAAADIVKANRGSVPGNLRAIAANLTDAELIGWWTEQTHQWITQARAALQLDPPRPKHARGAACPECKAEFVYTQQETGTVRTPALSVSWVGPADQDYHEDREWKVRAVECRECKVAWFRGESMDALIDMMMEANRTRETMTDDIA